VKVGVPALGYVVCGYYEEWLGHYGLIVAAATT
jgi:hypothetical protein